jgi:hypothetical protein
MTRPTGWLISRAIRRCAAVSMNGRMPRLSGSLAAIRRCGMSYVFRMVKFITPVAAGLLQTDPYIGASVQLAAEGLLKVVRARLPAAQAPSAGAALHQALSTVAPASIGEKDDEYASPGACVRCCVASAQ